MSDLSAELIAKLEAENDQLREEVRQLRKILTPKLDIPVEWGLTDSEEMVFACLLSRNFATKEMIMMSIYSDSNVEIRQEKICDVFICKIRRKLKPFGIEIHTKWGSGWWIDSEHKHRFLAKAA